MTVYAPTLLMETVMLLLSLALAIMGTVVAGQDTSFFYNGFDPIDPSLQYSGDALVSSNGQLDLTKNAPSSVGHALYGAAIRLFDPSSGTVASFSTNFSFQIVGQHDRTGEGLAFVLLGSNSSFGDAAGGPFLGVYNSDGAQVTTTLAVEFDTFKNKKEGKVEIDDINGNHVGLDLDVIQSRIQVDAGSVGITLADGSIFTSWIDYTASTSTIDVRITHQSADWPVNPLLSYQVDLSSVLGGSEYAWIGFSAATGDYCFESHTVCTWGFSSWGLPPWCPPPAPPTVFPPNPTPTPTPAPSQGWPVSPPKSPPVSPPTPAPSQGGPVSPPTSPPVSPPTPTPSQGGPVSPPTSPRVSPPTPTPTPTPSHGGPVSYPPSPLSGLPPTSGGAVPPPSSPNNDHPERWAVPVGVGCALVFGFFLLFFWRRHRMRPPHHPPPPPPPHHHPPPHPQPPHHHGPHGPPPHPHHMPLEEVLIIEG